MASWVSAETIYEAARAAALDRGDEPRDWPEWSRLPGPRREAMRRVTARANAEAKQAARVTSSEAKERQERAAQAALKGDPRV